MSRGGMDDDAVAALVEMTGVRKSYGGALACRDVDFTLHAGEGHALLGENGAGKSTLMNILAGEITDHQGMVAVAGTPVRFGSPVDAQHAGIAMIHQELDLVPGLSVAENIFLGREPRTRIGTVDVRSMQRQTRELLDRTGVALDPRRPVGPPRPPGGELRPGEQQLLTIAKALALDARVLIMDEPSSALSQAEVEQLLIVVAELRKSGTGAV